MTPHRSRGTNFVIAALGVIALLVAFVLVAERADDSVPEAQGGTVYDHLKEFQALADEHGDRATGTSGYEAAAQYVEQQLDRAGYQSTRQYFTFEDHGETFESFNIIAETDRGSDDNVIMLGAHLDGVPDSPAINDNASGAAALLEAANELSQQENINNKVRFAWWAAEEFPITYGSEHYVEDLADNDRSKLDNIAAYLNFDMVASPNYIIGIYDAGGTDEAEGSHEHTEDSHHQQRSQLEVPDGSMKIMEFFTDYFDSRGQHWVATHWNFDSDQVPFIEEGIAVGGLFTGSNENKSARQANLFGGTAGQPRDPNYHAPDDDISNVSQEALSIMTDAITHAATSLAVDSSALQ